MSTPQSKQSIVQEVWPVQVAQARSRSPAAKSTATAMSDSGQKDARQKPPSHWHETLTCAKVFSGVNLVRQRRWALECVARLRGSRATPEEFQQAMHLEEHLKLTDAAMTVMTNLSASGWDSLKAPLGELQAFEVDFPSSIKLKLLAKFILHLLPEVLDRDSSDDSMKNFVDILNPFGARSDLEHSDDELDEPKSQPAECDDAVAEGADEFDPLSPCLRLVEGSLATKCTQALNIWMKDVLPALFEFGEEGLLKVVVVAKLVIQQFESGVTPLSEIPQPALETLTVFRILHVVADASDIDFDPQDIQQLAISPQMDTKSQLAAFRSLIVASPAYSSRLADVQELVQNGMASVAELKELLASIGSLEKVASLPVFAKLTQAMKVVQHLLVSFRKGITIGLEKAVNSFLRTLVRTYTSDVQKGLAPLGDDILKAFLDLLNLAFDIWQEDMMKCASAKINEELGNRVCLQGINSVIDMAKDIITNTTAELAQMPVGALGEALHRLHQSSMTEASAKQLGGLAEGLIKIFEKFFPDGRELGICIETMLTLSGTAVNHDGIQKLAKSMNKGAALSLELQRHSALGDDFDMRLESDEGLVATQAVLQKAAAFNEAVDAIQPDHLPIVLESLKAETKNFSQGITTAALTKRVASMKALMEAVTVWSGGFEGGERWHNHCEEGISFDAFLDFAKGTLLTRTPEEYKSMRDEALAKAADCERTCMMLGVTPPPEVSAIKGLGTILAISYIEGLLVCLYASTQGKDVYKSKTHGIKKLAKSMGLKWERDVSSRLQERAVKALKLTT